MMRKINEIKVNSMNAGEIVFTHEGYNIVNAGMHMDVMIWNAVSGQLLRTLNCPHETPRRLTISPDGSILAVNGYNTPLYLWDTASWDIIRTIDMTEGVIFNLAFNADGKIIGRINYSTKAVELWDIQSGALLNQFDFNYFTFDPLKHEISFISGDGIATFDIYTKAFINTFRVNEKLLLNIVFNSNRRWMAAETESEKICLFQPYDGGIRRIITKNQLEANPTFSPDGKTLAITYLDSAVGLWDVETGEELGYERAAFDGSWGLTFSSDGKLLACGAGGRSGGIIEVWQLT